MTAKKDLEPFIGENIVIIPVGITGNVSENAKYLDDLISKFKEEHPKILLNGSPQIYFTPPSAGRKGSIDCILISRGQKPSVSF